MTVSAFDTFRSTPMARRRDAAAPAANAVDGAALQRLTGEARAEVERLAHSLFFTKEGEHRTSVLLGGIGEGPSSSRWLAIGAGVALSARGRRAHVLCLGPAPARTVDLPSTAGAGTTGEHASMQLQPAEECIVEYLDRSSTGGLFGDVLEDRLKDLRHSGDLILVHTDNLLLFPEVLSLAEYLDGVALVVRASHTRKAAVGAVRTQLSAAEIPVLGAVLVDRTFPIPEKLYRLL